MKRYYLGVDWSNKVHELCVIEEALKRRDRGSRVKDGLTLAGSISLGLCHHTFRNRAE